jgi:hypothetical protein
MKKYELIMQNKFNEFNQSDNHENSLLKKCFSESFNYKEKKLKIEKLKKNFLNDKFFFEKHLANLKYIMKTNKFIIEFFSKKQKFLNFIQKKFYLNNFLTIPLKEKLIEYIEFYISEILSSKQNFHQKEKIFDFFFNFISNKKFENLNKDLNLIDKDLHEIFKKILKKEKLLRNKKKFQNELIEEFKKTCIIFDYEKYNEIYVNNNQAVKKIISENFPNLKKLNFCSNEIILIKFFTLRIFNLKFLKKNLISNSYVIFFEKILVLLKKIKKIIENQIEKTSEEFNLFNEKFSGKFDYINNQIKLFKEKENFYIKEILRIKEKLNLLKNYDTNENEIKLFDNVFESKKSYCNILGKFTIILFIYYFLMYYFIFYLLGHTDNNINNFEPINYHNSYKEDFRNTLRNFLVVKNIFEYDTSIVGKVFENNKKKANNKKIINTFIELPSEIEKLKDANKLIIQEVLNRNNNNIEKNITITNSKLDILKDKKIYDTINNLENTMKKINKDSVEDDINFDE